MRLENRSTGLAGWKTCFGWPDASPNTLIAFGKKFVFIVLVQLTSDH